MPLNLNTEKLYEVFTAKCNELKCPTKTKEEFKVEQEQKRLFIKEQECTIEEHIQNNHT
jgi:hypothetical protein